MSYETQIAITLRQVDLSLARARYYEKRIEVGAYKGRVVHRGGLDGPVLTEDELCLDELDTMQRHIKVAQEFLDYAQGLQSKAQVALKNSSARSDR